MLNSTQISRTVGKLEALLERIDSIVFTPVDELKAERFQTEKQYYEIPKGVEYIPTSSGDIWGGESTYCWFKGSWAVPAALAGKPIFLRPDVGGYEALLWVNGQTMGTFATKIVVTGHGNHYCDMIAQAPEAGENIDIALEYYSGHYVMGELPFQTRPRSDFRFAYNKIQICTRNDLAAQFMFDLKTALSLYRATDSRSFRHGDLENAFVELHKVLWYSLDDTEPALLEDGFRRGREVLARVLSKKNGGDTVPYAGIIGHSHMDTAWLWHIDETIKKCARTYSNQMNLMRQYPEYKFIQSSSYHSEMIREHYPELFERIREKVAEGRYEPNGGVWVECDCNITSGESMIRQFLWGQRFTRKYFGGYTSDAFWLPDTFGYSAAIPQIMRGCGVKYFLTTKIAWNDTNKFPYDTFVWRGIDGTSVFAHFNKTHIGTAPDEIIPLFYGSSSDAVRQNNVSKAKLVSFGYGDGGGGPQWDQIELTRRCADLEGCPKYEYTTVSSFMQKLEKEAVDPACYAGELYLELHRGTLTNQHQIKRNNRLAEIALHDVEFIKTVKSLAAGSVADDAEYRHLQNRLLVNQFHDILPGTCIPRANQQSKREMGELIKEAGEIAVKLLAPAEGSCVTVCNTTSFAREDTVYVECPENMRVAGGYVQQRVTKLDGRSVIAVAGVKLAPMSSVVLALEEGEVSTGASAFAYAEDTVVTPFAALKFNAEGTIESYYDKTAARELRGEGYPFNTFLIAEDVPAAWDNWDLDADIELKFTDSAMLVSRMLVADGPVELCVRSVYRLTAKSKLTQDIVFSAFSPIVRFETQMSWYDDHRFLKTAFDTGVFADFVRQEIQFGNIKRPTTRNTSVEQAKFEVLNHKYTDLSEPRYGVAILNDSKYAISANGGQLRLSLHKGGCRPDYTGDHGEHYCEYAFLPHNCGYSAEAVIKPAYEFNYKPRVYAGSAEIASLAAISAPNVIIEAVKPCEDAERAFIIRLYEAEGSRTAATLSLGFKPTKACVTNMLEEPQSELEPSDKLSLVFRPFEIKTIKLSY